MNHLKNVVSVRQLAVLVTLLFSLLMGLVRLSAEEKLDSPPLDSSGKTELLKLFVKELVSITPGKGKFPQTFQMGSTTGEPSERPVHKVIMSDDFWMSRYEVPQNLYQAVMGNNPSRWGGPRNSAEMFDWQTANEFCRKLTSELKKAKLIAADEVIRLPSEAEWEYCCRAGTSTEYSFGDQPQKQGDEGKQARILDEYAWHTGNAAGNDPPVGALKPNPWGLYDMHGYLWEFVADPWHDSYQNAPGDGSVWGTVTIDKPVVVRGGAWTDPYNRLRSASRRQEAATTASPALGLRCVKAKVKKSEN
ncbi:formylglycine-generating enzyme family protein [Gimesia algae]|uniref:Formylglycine-generating sulfatase enzyme n=1 Tax=Gimesia algae TaxID=2527971 RepID=A0A517VJW6_9PLAN|nr:formylglycine-generating enzyme family protein [Gimesia algae]QDT93257.1 Formylglycine-generating sulfatase enzyme [Gimesia algae]